MRSLRVLSAFSRVLPRSPCPPFAFALPSSPCVLPALPLPSSCVLPEPFLPLAFSSPHVLPALALQSPAPALPPRSPFNRLHLPCLRVLPAIALRLPCPRALSLCTSCAGHRTQGVLRSRSTELWSLFSIETLPFQAGNKTCSISPGERLANAFEQSSHAKSSVFIGHKCPTERLYRLF